ncbi:MAG: pyrimidine/purine nucleoside phosphorylase [Halothiobacillaceae bacterium]
MLQVNEHHEGRVKSIGFETATLPATVGVMEPGQYDFQTQRAETIHVISGNMRVRVGDEVDWQVYDEGERFDIPAESRFEVAIEHQTAYLCLYC